MIIIHRLEEFELMSLYMNLHNGITKIKS